jgi:hypothetical protein
MIFEQPTCDRDSRPLRKNGSKQSHHYRSSAFPKCLVLNIEAYKGTRGSRRPFEKAARMKRVMQKALRRQNR